MRKTVIESLLRMSTILALNVCVYLLRTPPSINLDFEGAIDELVDSGFNFPESKQELALLDLRKILVTTAINAQNSHKIIQKLLILNDRNPQTPIDLYLRTEGGWEADAYSIIDVMQNISAPVNIHAIGEVHSSGAMILIAGTGQRIVYPNTILGFHALAEDEGKLWEARYERLWADYSRIPDEWLAQRDGEMIYFSAKEALEYSVATQLMHPDPNTARNNEKASVSYLEH